MSVPTAEIRVTSFELTVGTIRSVTVTGEDGTTRVVGVNVPPGTENGAVLRVSAPGGDIDIHVTTDPPPESPPTSPPAFGPSDRARRRIVLFTGIAAAIVVLVVALITANTDGHGTGTSGPTSHQARPPAPTKTTTPPESAAAYQQALNGLATAFNNGLTELNGAQTPDQISTAITDLTNDVSQAQAAFGDNPPVGTADANAALVTALRNIDADFTAVDQAASSDQVCLGPAALALLSRQTSINALRTAIAALTNGAGGLGYQFGASLPPHLDDAARAGTNGAIVTGGGTHGLGELTISNGGSTDATVALVPGQGAPLVTVYMGHDGNYTLHHIPDGTYTVYVTSGDDWDAGARLFSRNCDFEQFDQTMDFTTTSTEYTTYTITLTPVPGGDATLSEVDPGAFPH